MAKAMRGTFTVEVAGYKELMAGIARADPELYKAMRKAGKASAEIIAEEARRRIRSSRGPGSRDSKDKGKFAASIKTSSTKTGVRLVFGGATAPWGPVNEFGGSIPVRGGAGGKLMRHRELLYEYGVAQRRQSEWQKKTGVTSAATRALRQSRSGRFEFKPWDRSGYFIFPSIHAEKAAMIKRYREEAHDAIYKSLHAGRISWKQATDLIWEGGV